MRVRTFTVVAALVFAGCSSGTRTVVLVRDRPAPPVTTVVLPVPVTTRPPAPLPPLEVALGRPSAGKLVVQTNRPAYVAIFEIVPLQGVTLAHPSTLRQSTIVLSGISSIPVSWQTQQPERRVGATGRPMRATRYLYAIASDKPLRISEAAFQPGYLEQVLGPAVYRAASPQPMTQALMRHFAPAALAGRWAEDTYAIAPSDETAPYRVARIYCAGGTVYEVPENIADRSWCPAPQSNNGRGRGAGQTADQSSTSPDSILTQDGRRIHHRGYAWGRGEGSPTRDQTPPAPAPVEPTPRATPDPRKSDHAGNQDNARPDRDRAERERADKDKADKDKADKDKADKDKADKDRTERERFDKERFDRERVEKERADKAEKMEKERGDRDRAEKERADRERRDAERLDTERVEKERAEKERSEKARIDADHAAHERADRERADRERAEVAERARRERDKADSVDSAAKAEKAEKEKAEKAEKERVEKDKVEKEKAEKDKEEKARAEEETAKAEKDKAAKAEQEKVEKEKADKEKADKEKADKEKAEKDKSDKDKADPAADDSGDKQGAKGKRRPPVKTGPPFQFQS